MFAATGRLKNAKSAEGYQQKMLELENDYPWVYQHFTGESFHCISRTDKFWARLWTDLVMEQTMTQSLRNLGGLTRGGGMGENTRIFGVATLHSCAEV